MKASGGGSHVTNNYCELIDELCKRGRQLYREDTEAKGNERQSDSWGLDEEGLSGSVLGS